VTKTEIQTDVKGVCKTRNL